jgi:hypothetical protein
VRQRCTLLCHDSTWVDFREAVRPPRLRQLRAGRTGSPLPALWAARLTVCDDLSSNGRSAAAVPAKGGTTGIV